ncbi:MAG: hypothetical protein GYB68_12265, partial [Chloroflexi bacterium]|nr:hypothetical protein [Chloroflexota bacterium]
MVEQTLESQSAQPVSQPAKQVISLETMMAFFGLFIILMGAAYVRFTGLDWDEGHLVHPDETFVSWVTSSMSSVPSATAYFDTENSTLNPVNVGHAYYVYGNFPTILTRYIGEAIETTSLWDVYLTGRRMSAGFDLVAVFFVFLIGLRLFDWRVGLLSSLFYGMSALAIQLSHFYAVDTFANTFTVIAFYFAALALTRHNWIDYPLFGLALGLGMASKITIAPLALILILALMLRVWRELAEPSQAQGSRAFVRLALRAFVGLSMAGLMTIATFRVAQPYAFLPPNSAVEVDAEKLGPALTMVSTLGDPIGMRPNPTWIDNMRTIQYQVSGAWDAPPNHQWAHRPPLIYAWTNMVRFGMGLPLGLWVTFAFFWALWEIRRGSRFLEPLALLVLWTGLFFLWQGSGWVMAIRYYLPIYWTLALLGAWALVLIWDRVIALLESRRITGWHWARSFSLGLMLLVSLGAIGWGLAVHGIYLRPMTRVEASRWIYENVPSDVALRVETEQGWESVQLGFHNNWLPIDSRDTDDPTQPGYRVTQLAPGAVNGFEFSVPTPGELSSLRFHSLRAAGESPGVTTMQVTIARDQVGNEPLTSGTITSDFAETDEGDGRSYEVVFDPIDVSTSERYWL